MKDRLEGGDPLRGSVLTLLKLSFGMTAPPPDVRHYFLVEDGAVVAYCASRTITTSVAGQACRADHLGLVCVAEDRRRAGYGSRLVRAYLHERASAGAEGTLLNCGAVVQPFYEKLGFRKVADRASYVREGTLQVDDDPVLGYWYEGRPPLLLTTQTVPFGADL